MRTARRRSLVRSRLIGGSVLVGALLVASLPLTGRATIVESTSWIDAPLDGAILPVAPYRVVSHSADQDGVALVVFAVDGLDVDGFEDPATPRLATTRFVWTPPGPGIFVLEVRARNTLGEWGAPASATVIVSETAPSLPPNVEPTPGPSGTPDPSGSPGPSGSLPPGVTPTPGGPTPTPGQSTRVTPGPSSTPPPTPTPPPCTPGAPALIVPADGSTIGGATEVLEWLPPSGDCQPVMYRVELATNRAMEPLSETADLPGDVTTWLTPPLTECTRYYWRVSAFGGGGQGGTSTVWSFVVPQLLRETTCPP